MADTDRIPIYKQKTFWTAIAALVGSVAGYFTGEMSIVSAISAILVALGGIFMRQGIEKAKVNPTTNAALRGDANITG